MYILYICVTQSDLISNHIPAATVLQFVLQTIYETQVVPALPARGLERNADSNATSIAWPYGGSFPLVRWVNKNKHGGLPIA